MVVYGEYLFLENFVAGVAFAVTSKLIAGFESGKLRIILSGVLSGIFPFVVFLNLSGASVVALTLAFSMIQAVVLFGIKSPGKLIVCGFIYLLVTILYGGITIAIINLLRLPILTYGPIIAGGAVAVMAVAAAISIVREKKIDTATRVRVDVDFDGKQWELDGLIDTGNYLRDPFGGKPVALVSHDLLVMMTEHLEDREIRKMPIPYKSVGVTGGLLWGYRANSIQVGNKVLHKPIVGEFPAYFSDTDNFQILLPRDLMERGIYGDD